MTLIDKLAGGNKSAFAKTIGVGSGVVGDIIGGRFNKPSFDVLSKIVTAYPQVRLDWIIKGEEPMLITDFVNTKQPLHTQQPLSTKKDQVRILVATQDTSHNVTIPIVNQQAAANYLSGFQSQEFFESLEPMTMPRFMINGGQNAVFQVRGESMEPTFFDSEYVICSKVDRSNWQYINDFDVYVVVSEVFGVQLKRVKNRLKAKGFMRFRSDNRTHKDFSLNEDEILELWRFQWKLSPFAVNRAEDLYKKVDNMEDELESLKGLVEKLAGQLGANFLAAK